MTPFEGAKAQNVMLNKKRPGELLVAVNDKDKAKKLKKKLLSTLKPISMKR